MCAINGFGSFRYPVRIRQTGADGMMCLSAAEINAFHSSQSSYSKWNGDYDQWYVRGTVKKISERTVETGVATADGLFYNPTTATYSATPLNLETRIITIDVEGASIDVKAQYDACYGLLNAMKVSAGDVVEVNVDSRGIIVSYDGFIVSPQAVVKAE